MNHIIIKKDKIDRVEIDDLTDDTIITNDTEHNIYLKFGENANRQAKESSNRDIEKP